MGMSPNRQSPLRELLKQTQDLELFWDLKHAVEHGLVGHIKDLLPELLIYLIEAQMPNYAQEIYETLHFLYCESTSELRHAIRKHCWLVNMSGQKNGFYPVDQRQELNNKDIRYGAPPQGRASWEDYEKASILIPTYAEIVKHVQDSHSHVHKDPPWEKKLSTLMQDCTKTKALIPIPGCQIHSQSECSKDSHKAGVSALQDTDTLHKYAVLWAAYFLSQSMINSFSFYIKHVSTTPETPETPSVGQAPLYSSCPPSCSSLWSGISEYRDKPGASEGA
ncbi:hypothetical protein FRC12_004163 [Ceratobasidium sp. 428]|nr:hypothetical protein FRC12_004163 [Ceratobasidium sp. 428]